MAARPFSCLYLFAAVGQRQRASPAWIGIAGACAARLAGELGAKRCGG